MKKILLSIALTALLAASCGEQIGESARLHHIDSLMNASPAEALQLVDSLLGITAADPAPPLTTAFHMQLRLRRLNAQNKLDTVFTSRYVDEAKTLVEHFDRSGTPNERMLAHYLLGRTYADTHEAPMALEAYQDAAACADTTAADCNYRQLGIIYGQMANIFYRQGLYQEDLAHLDKSICYARKANNTVGALLSYAQKMNIYDQLKMGDSALFVSKYVSSQFHNLGIENMAAAFLAPTIVEFVNRGQVEAAKQYMNVYESASGYFNDKHEIQKGREKYYHVKGCYYLASHQFDSAEYFFRKELRDGLDFNNQNCGSYGLALLFQQTNRLDSAIKYALFSHEMCDSFYAQRATDAVAQTKELYDYTRHQREAQQKKELADKEHHRFLYACALAFAILLLVGVLIYKNRQQLKKRRKEEEEFQKLLSKQQQAEDELKKLKAHESEFQMLISEKQHLALQQEADTEELQRLRKSEQTLRVIINNKEKETDELREILKTYQQNERFTRQRVQTLKDTLYGLTSYNAIRHKVDCGNTLSEEDWDILYGLLNEYIPEYALFVTRKSYLLTERERKACILIRLYFTPKSIASAFNVDKAIVSRMRATLHQKLFDEPGNSRELDQKLLKIL